MDFNRLQQKIKSFDWRSLQKFTSAQAGADLNTFLENMPQNVGKKMLIVAACAWVCAGGLGLYTTVQLQKLTEIRAELEEASALKPNVPSVRDVAVSGAEVQRFIERIKDTYGGLEIKVSGTSILITSNTTASFGQFREAIGHIQNGGSGWRVNIDRLCVGRECDRYPLAASLKINKVSVSQSG